MHLIKLGKKGQVSIPAALLSRLGLSDGSTLIAETTEDGAVVLRPAAVYPVELYSEQRIREFEKADAIKPVEEKRLTRALKRR
ncbi:MAG TPA: AbrB/MazE/SpoVT family DNA-binding domain-containing protein [Burkholderiales bacterium]|nr:AbrB/MazE/SpoVT family DNA-binding domain-containing protein [Burkholderiales bacterium]